MNPIWKNLFSLEPRPNHCRLKFLIIFIEIQIDKIVKQNYSLRGSKGIDLDSAAAIENDETMIINSDHSIITTPVESPAADEASTSGAHRSPEKKVESDETPTSDSSVSAAVPVEKNKRHRPKARSESNRSEKYAKFIFDPLFLV